MSSRTLEALSPALQKRKLRAALLAFLILLLIPLGILTKKIYSQLEMENFFVLFDSSQELHRRISAKVEEILRPEEDRSFGEYSFFLVAEDSNELTRSPLSFVPPKAGPVGVIGFFQIDPNNNVHFPFLPERGEFIPPEEQQSRQTVGREILAELDFNKLKTEEKRELAASSPETLELKLREEPDAKENAEISQEKLSSLNIDDSTFQKQATGLSKGPKTFYKKENRENLKVQSIVPADPILDEVRKQMSRAGAGQNAASPAARTLKNAENTLEQGRSVGAKVTNISGEVEPFKALRTNTGKILFYRYIYRPGGRYQQGFIVREKEFLAPLIRDLYNDSTLSSEVSLVLGYGGNILMKYQATPDAETSYLSRSKGKAKEVVDKKADNKDFAETLLYRSFLPDPLDKYELLFVAKDIGVGPSGNLTGTLLFATGAILIFGLSWFYLLGARQIDLTKERNDFISAVSHELRTPLTSIRMYAEMLREGWAQDESKKRSYYDYIFQESERLSRLISNVLQFARFNREKEVLVTVERSPDELLNFIIEKTQTQVNALELEKRPEPMPRPVVVRHVEDYIAQIFINLVDNAIKFSKDSSQKIAIGYRPAKSSKYIIEFFIRDYGKGIAPLQLKRIFDLFYRGEDELTRNTPGTGIGLALVKELCQQMGAEIDVVNKQPGAEFIVRLPGHEVS